MNQKGITFAAPVPTYAERSDEDLIDLLFTEGDRLPMAFAQEATRRGERLVPALSGVVRDRKNWERNDAGWAAVIHASFLLGSIGGDHALQALLEVIRLSEEFDNDWVASELPAIFGRLGPKALPPLNDAALDQGEEWPYRHRALSAMAAVASRHPEHAEDVFPFIASIAQDAKEDGDTRAWAGCVLLDFPQERYRELLHSLIDLGTAGRIFDERSIDRSFSKMKPRLDSYQRDWLLFYAPGPIAERQKRWGKERLSEDDAWEEATSTEDKADEYDELFAPPEEPDRMSRRQVLEALGPVAELIPKTREAIEASGGEIDKAALERQAALARELGKAIRIRDAKSSQGPKTLSLFSDALGRHDLFGWLVPLPMELATKDMVREGATLAKLWSAIAEAENFLGDRAVILAEAGLAEEAREQIRENLEHFPEDTWIRIKAGVAYRAIKDFAAAEAEYRKGLALAGDDRGVRSAAIDRIAELWREAGKAAEADTLEADERRRLEEAEQRRYGASQTVVRSGPKIGRNDPCPCDSGKKHKKCCLGSEAVTS